MKPLNQIHIILSLLFLVLQIADCAGLWWVVGKPFILDVRRICRKARRLKGNQFNMCRKESELVEKIIEGAEIGMNECQHQLRFHRWNCTTVRRSLGKMLLRDTRESAFIQAITSSAVVYKLARACSSGEVVSCGCANGTPQLDTTEENWKWAGCDANVEFGVRKSREFMDAQTNQYKDVKATVLHHNNEVGRSMLKKNVELKCRCHGMSGSCQYKSCWRTTRKFRTTGNQLYDKFKTAKAVSPGNDGPNTLWTSGHSMSINNLRTNNIQRRSIPEEELVYVDQSPDFCKRNRQLGVLGPKGRICNATKGSAGSCDYLCCQRGYNVTVVEQQSNCNCHFKWCCEVVCKKCIQSVNIHTCK